MKKGGRGIFKEKDMVVLENCKKLLSKKSKTDTYFLDLHFCLEALIKRLLFIGLRLNGVQYKDAQNFLARYDPMGLKKSLNKAWELIGISLQELECYPNYQVLYKLVFEFTSQYRNARVHDKKNKYDNKDLLELLITIDKRFIDEIRKILKEKKNADIFDKPKQFGAVTVRERRDPEEILQKVFNKQGRLTTESKYSIEEARTMVTNLQ
ncbi:MAG: hypothetical protein LBU51_00485 [Bacteroidales bacterium]|jgi:hypothetical protein|nr:hypothetical protein [Bacteroidales bacterium]